MTEGYERLIKDFNENCGNSVYSNLTLKIMELERLDRIATALEGIDSKLGKCVGKEGTFFICGDVTTYEG